MKAAVYTEYGPSSVVSVQDRPAPKPGPNDIQVRVHAAGVTTGDWRLRAAAFPGIMALPGRLMFGIRRPKVQILGGDFAGVVSETGAEVRDFKPGDAVFGFSGQGAHAEYLTMPASGAVMAKPGQLSDAEAAALPFGALCALVFLRDYAQLAPGQSILIVGASGGVGAYAVQIAKAMGARVTGVASTANQDFVRALGADQAMAYDAGPYLPDDNRFDVVFDAVGAVSFAQVRPALKSSGLFIPLNFGLRDIFAALTNRWRRGPGVKIGVNGDSAEDLRAVAALVADGKVRPVIDTEYPLAAVSHAHAHVESRHRNGAIILTMAKTERPRLIA